jgi:hypothetical protein
MSDQEALRNEIARAVQAAIAGAAWGAPGGLCYRASDAVLPILQRRETALVEQVRALADALDSEANDAAGLGLNVRCGVKRDAARRLRSILPTSQGEPQ